MCKGAHVELFFVIRLCVVFLNCLIFLKRLVFKQVLEAFSHPPNWNKAHVAELKVVSASIMLLLRECMEYFVQFLEYLSSRVFFRILSF